MRVVVYYRSRLSEPIESEKSLIEQRSAFAAWEGSHRDIETIAKLTEDESHSDKRPVLKTAINECQKSGATLVVVSTEAIGRGSPFYPRIVSVPIIKLPTPDRPLGFVKPIPPNAPAGLSLYFDNHAEDSLSDVYLCNNSIGPLRDVTAVCVTGTTMGLAAEIGPTTEPNGAVAGPYVSPTQTVQIEKMSPGTASLITDYDALVDGDFILVFEVSFTLQSQPQQARAVIDKGGYPPRFASFNVLVNEPVD